MLEIHVFDKVVVFDSLVKAIEFVIGVFKKWHKSDSEAPLSMGFFKKESTGPTSLEINVSEKVKTKTAFG